MVEIFKAWKKLICEGSSPVGPAGTEKSIGAITPILASVGILLASILPLSSWTEASVKIRATFCLSNGVRAWSSGSFPPNCCYKCLNYSSSMPLTLILRTFLMRVWMINDLHFWKWQAETWGVWELFWSVGFDLIRRWWRLWEWFACRLRITHKASQFVLFSLLLLMHHQPLVI